MKTLILSLSLLSSMAVFGSEMCDVETQLAPIKANVFDRTEGRSTFSAAMAEAHLQEEAGAVCAEVIPTGTLYVVKAYYKVLSGPNVNKLLEVDIILKQY